MGEELRASIRFQNAKSVPEDDFYPPAAQDSPSQGYPYLGYCCRVTGLNPAELLDSAFQVFLKKSVWRINTASGLSCHHRPKFSLWFLIFNTRTGAVYRPPLGTASRCLWMTEASPFGFCCFMNQPDCFSRSFVAALSSILHL